MSAAKAAFPAWRALGPDKRAEYLVTLADAILANREGFIELLGKEAGKPPQAAGFELFLVEDHVTRTPTLRLPEEKPEDNEDVRMSVLLRFN